MGAITESVAFPGKVNYQDVVAVVINAANDTNSFTVNDLAGTAALTLNTGTASGNTVTVNGTSYAATLNINNQGANSQTAVTSTYSRQPDRRQRLGQRSNRSGPKPLTAWPVSRGDVLIKSKAPDSDTLYVNDTGDGQIHTGAHAITVTGTSITGLARGTISYSPSTLSNLTLQGDGRNADWNVQGTPIPYTYAVRVGGKNSGFVHFVALPTTTDILGAASDIVNLGGPSNGLQDIYGTLNIESPWPVRHGEL